MVHVTLHRYGLMHLVGRQLPFTNPEGAVRQDLEAVCDEGSSLYKDKLIGCQIKGGIARHDRNQFAALICGQIYPGTCMGTL